MGDKASVLLVCVLWSYSAIVQILSYITVAQRSAYRKPAHERLVQTTCVYARYNSTLSTVTQK